MIPFISKRLTEKGKTLFSLCCVLVAGILIFLAVKVTVEKSKPIATVTVDPVLVGYQESIQNVFNDAGFKKYHSVYITLSDKNYTYWEEFPDKSATLHLYLTLPDQGVRESIRVPNFFLSLEPYQFIIGFGSGVLILGFIITFTKNFKRIKNRKERKKEWVQRQEPIQAETA